jgi:hypothetical protein
MHAQSVRTKSRFLVAMTFAGLAVLWCPRSPAVGVPAQLHPPVTARAEVSTSAPADAARDAAGSVAAEPTGPVPERLLQWEFSYQGRRLKAQGFVLTRAEPSPSGTYEIVSITGKRNKRDIGRLVPQGELMTMYGLLFSDNRLWTQPPYLTQSGFTFHTGSGVYFNVCYTGPYEGCGDITQDDYRPGYYETDFRGRQRPIEFTLKPTSTVVVAVVPPLEENLPLDVIQTCDSAAPSRESLAWVAAGTMTSFSAPGSDAASADVPCAPASIDRNRL